MWGLSTIGLLGVGLLLLLTVAAILKRSRRDAVTMLTVFLVFLTLIPAHLIVQPIGAAGTPAMLVALALAWWWLGARLNPQFGIDLGPQPIRIAILVHGWFMLLTYGLMYLRPLTELEVSGAHRALIALVALSGVALLAADGIEDFARLDRLLRRIVGFGAVMAGIGVIQFLTSFDPVRLLQIPGLHTNHEIFGIGARSIFNRPFSTTLHPIEFSVVMAMLLPLALHYALFAVTRGQRLRWWSSAALIAAGVPMSLSRSGVLGLVAGLVVLALAWSWRRRLQMGVVALAFTGFMWATIPGLIGTIRSLFMGWETDTSIQARTDRVPRVLELLTEHPWLGRGMGTYSVEDYFLLDNQYYVSVIEVGLIGVTVILALLCTGLAVGWTVYRRSEDPLIRHLATALAAGIVVVIASIATFDAFFYRIFSGLMFLLLGCLGALWRFSVAMDVPSTHALAQAPGRSVPAREPRPPPGASQETAE